MSHLCLWPRNTLEYDGCCSHTALNEGPSRGHDFADEQLEAQAAELQVKNHKKKLEASSVADKMRKERSPERYATLNRAKDATYRKKRLASKKHYCEICEIALKSPSALAMHKLSKRHIAKEAAHLSSSKLD